MPVRHGQEYYDFVVDCYAVGDEATNNHLLYDSAFFSRPKGCDKSGSARGSRCSRRSGPCRFAGWAKGGEVYRDPWGLGFEYEYEPGEPMGAPVHVPVHPDHGHRRGPDRQRLRLDLLQPHRRRRAAVEGARRQGGLARDRLPGGGEITPSTASSASKDGGKETFVVFDETHLYNTPRAAAMYKTVTRNMRKRKKIAGTWYLETTTMYAPARTRSPRPPTSRSAADQGAAAEAAAAAVRPPVGRVRGPDATSSSCAIAIRRRSARRSSGTTCRASSTSSRHPQQHTQDSAPLLPQRRDRDRRRWFANASSRRSSRPDAVLADRDVIALGFDGSRKRNRGVTDATALIAFRLRDRCLFEIRIWEQPLGPEGRTWEIPRLEVDAEVRDAFRRFTVVAFYADPAKWEETVGTWERDYGRG
jgi:hypothetical protein